MRRKAKRRSGRHSSALVLRLQPREPSAALEDAATSERPARTRAFSVLSELGLSFKRVGRRRLLLIQGQFFLHVLFCFI